MKDGSCPRVDLFHFNPVKSMDVYEHKSGVFRWLLSMNKYNLMQMQMQEELKWLP